MRLVKGLFYTLTALVVIAAASVAYVTQVLDPNDLKPTLIRAAENQQISLTIDGPLSWTFYPWLGVSAEDVIAESPQGRLQADRLEGSVSLLSVFSQTLIVDRLTAIRPQVELTPQQPKPTSQPRSAEQQPLRPLIIRALAISEGTILGLQPDLNLDRVNLQLDSLSPGSESALSFNGLISYRNAQFPLTLDATLVPSVAFDAVTVRDVKLTSREAELNLDGYLSASLDGNLAAEGRLVIPEFSVRNWLRAANLEPPASRDLTTLNAVSMESNIKLSNQLLSFSPLTAVVDSTEIRATVDLNLAPLNLNLDAAINSLNLDAYLPASPPAATTASNPTASLPALIPGAYRLRIEALEVAQVALQTVAIELGVQPDEVSLVRFDMDVFGGKIRSSGSHLVAPQITNLNGTMDGIRLEMLPTNSMLQSLSGEIFAAFDVRTAGHSMAEAKASLTGPIRIRIAEASLGALNISETLCQALGQTGDLRAGSTDTLSLRAVFREGLAEIESLEAQVANVALSGTGRFSLVSTALNLTGQVGIPANGDLGQCVAPNAVRGMLVPLTCQGQIAENALSCGVDTNRLSSQIGLAAEEQLKKRARQAVEQQLEKSLDGQAQDLLKNLLKR